jgi:O-antigen ligase
LPLRLNPEKVEAVRLVGIYLGPVILGSVIGNAIYGFAFNTRAINIEGVPVFIDVLFFIAGALIAWQMREPLGRSAWAVFALHHGLQALMAPLATRMRGLWSLCLTVLFAVLVTGSGARSASRRTLALAAAISVIVVVAAFGARYYADELLGNHSVIR